MGNPLTGSTVASTYTSLLKTDDNATLTSSLKAISDGSGINSALQVSTAGVASSGTLAVTGAATLSSTLAVTGATNLSSLSTSGNATVGGTLNVTGATTLGALTMTGNLSVPGTLSSTGNFAVNTNKFTVASASGNTTVAGTLDSTGDFKVATNKFTVASASGNTVVGGTLGVSGASNLSTLTVSGLSQLAELDALSDTTVGGTFNVSGATTLSSVTANGNAALNGNLSVAGNTTIGNAAGDSLTVTAGAVTIDNLPSKTSPINADTLLLRDSAASNALKTVTVASVSQVRFAYSEDIVKTSTSGQVTSVPATIGAAVEVSGSTTAWEYTWTPKAIGNKCIIRVSIPLQPTYDSYCQAGIAESPYAASNYIGVGSSLCGSSYQSMVHAQAVFTSSTSSHTFRIFFTSSLGQVITVAANPVLSYFGNNGTSTFQAKVHFELIEFA